MAVLHYIKRFFSLPPHLAVRRAGNLIMGRVRQSILARRDDIRPTYSAVSGRLDLERYFTAVPTDTPELVIALADRYTRHYFDLLGSGWVNVRYGTNCRGVEGNYYSMGQPIEADRSGNWLKNHINRANLGTSRGVWKLIDPEYAPIDWQLDFKSGYRWSEATPYRSIVYGDKPGVDIKIPWELARMQHLPMFAQAFALTQDEKYIREFRNQTLDFIATNPPRFGVNWACTMDVGIRIANWLVSYDLFRAAGATFDAAYEQRLARSVYDHARHIVANLEWSLQLTSNHYLSDIVGLLFAAAYLPSTLEVKTWLAFAVQEVIGQVNVQFQPDGSNFEASTSYHRLSGELVIFATALVLGLSPAKLSDLQTYDHNLHRVLPTLKAAPLPLYQLPGADHATPFPNWYIERLERIAEFTVHITKPNGDIPQLGDNDSGRLFKLGLAVQVLTSDQAKQRYANLDDSGDLPDSNPYYDENILDHRHLVAAINGLFGRDDLADFVGESQIETALVRDLAKNTCFGSYLERSNSAAYFRIGLDSEPTWRNILREMSAPKYQIFTFNVSGEDWLTDLALCSHPDFGLYLFRSQRLYLAVRCGTIGQKGNGGHAHNDQLAVELNIDGVDWIADPGTYLYTPLPERRNEYRSVKAHFAPKLGEREPSGLSEGLFRLTGDPRAECLYFGSQGFIGRHTGFGQAVYRRVQFDRHAIIITDLVDSNIMRLDTEMPTLNPSPGYGKRLNTRLYCNKQPDYVSS